jgi:hypothetical protein
MTMLGGLEGTGTVFAEIWDAFERGDLIVQCAWCKSVRRGKRWVEAPPAVFDAIDARLALSHSICPRCTVRLAASSATGALS